MGPDGTRRRHFSGPSLCKPIKYSIRTNGIRLKFIVARVASVSLSYFLNKLVQKGRLPRVYTF